jgi:endonuclease-3
MADPDRERALEILRRLEKRHPEARTRLRFTSPFELLVATILAAQCTDERVNQTTPALFARYPDPESMADADLDELQELVRTTGFFRQKSKNLKATAGALVGNFGGEVPRTIEELVSLPGVGRKTANVMMGNCFSMPAIIVDTHFRRVMQRMGFTTSSDPDRIEEELRSVVPAARQTRFSMLVNEHGRLTCRARKPDCPDCPVSQLCRYRQKLL